MQQKEIKYFTKQYKIPNPDGSYALTHNVPERVMEAFLLPCNSGDILVGTGSPVKSTDHWWSKEKSLAILDLLLEAKASGYLGEII